MINSEKQFENCIHWKDFIKKMHFDYKEKLHSFLCEHMSCELTQHPPARHPSGGVCGNPQPGCYWEEIQPTEEGGCRRTSGPDETLRTAPRVSDPDT